MVFPRFSFSEDVKEEIINGLNFELKAIHSRVPIWCKFTEMLLQVHCWSGDCHFSCFMLNVAQSLVRVMSSLQHDENYMVDIGRRKVSCLTQLEEVGCISFIFIFYVYILYYIIQMLNFSLYVADGTRQINDHFHLLNNFVKRQLKTLARLH